MVKEKEREGGREGGSESMRKIIVYTPTFTYLYSNRIFCNWVILELY